MPEERDEDKRRGEERDGEEKEKVDFLFFSSLSGEVLLTPKKSRSKFDVDSQSSKRPPRRSLYASNLLENSFSLGSGPIAKGILRIPALGRREGDSRRRRRRGAFVFDRLDVDMRRSLAALAATLLSLVFVVQARERELSVIEDLFWWRGSI